MELVDGVNLRQAMKAGRSAKIASRVGLRGQGMASRARVSAQTYSTSDYCKWIVDSDIAGFFDTVSHEWLMRFVEHRIGDRRINRLVRKWLKAGVMEEGKLVTAEAGTPQGAVASPLLANIYLHYVSASKVI
jgi:retron-type reverse transcriptase